MRRAGWALAGMTACLLVVGCGQSSGADRAVDGGAGGGGAPASATRSAVVGDASNSPRSCPDLFDQTVVPAYAFEISADNWAKLDADFHDLPDVLAGTPPQSYYPVVFHYGAETVTDAAVRLRGKSSWVDTVMFDANPKMQFDIAFDQFTANQKFHGISTLHLEVARDDWTFLSERVGNNWFREIGLTAPCTNSATLSVNGAFYGLYAAEEGVNKALLGQFFPGNSGGDLFKGGTEAQSNIATANWTRLHQLQSATDIATLQGLADLSNTVLEWAAEVVVEDADGYYGGSHNYYVYDQGAAGYVWLLDHTDSAFAWVPMFTGLGAAEHPIYWWAGRPLPDPPAADYLLVINDPTWRARYVAAIATQTAKWNATEIQGWIDAWSKQIAGAIAQDPHKWATMDQVATAVAAMRDMTQSRPAYLQAFAACQAGDPAHIADQDGDGVPWCNDCDDANPAVHPGAPEVCGNQLDDNCNGVVDEHCSDETATAPGQP
jgi:hypothetical protein